MALNGAEWSGWRRKLLDKGGVIGRRSASCDRFICLAGHQLWRNLHMFYTRSPRLLHKRALALDKLCPPG
jgi:hypothetical protein